MVSPKPQYSLNIHSHEFLPASLRPAPQLSPSSPSAAFILPDHPYHPPAFIPLPSAPHLVLIKTRPAFISSETSTFLKPRPPGLSNPSVFSCTRDGRHLHILLINRVNTNVDDRLFWVLRDRSIPKSQTMSYEPNLRRFLRLCSRRSGLKGINGTQGRSWRTKRATQAGLLAWRLLVDALAFGCGYCPVKGTQHGRKTG